MLRTFLTLAELIRLFLDMFSISSTLVKPLHLQAIIGETLVVFSRQGLERTGSVDYSRIAYQASIRSDSDVTQPQ